MREKQSYSERAAAWLAFWFRQNRVPFLSAVLIGLLAHMFAFTNKLVNHDEIEALFSKGATITSGRWGLELIKAVFPDCSMPWLWGMVSVLLLSFSVCLIVRLFAIRRPLLQGLLAGLVLSFPSQVGTFCYMYTSSSYAVALLLAVSAAVLFCGRKGWQILCGLACMVLSLGIYQSYVAVTASLLVLYLLQKLLLGKTDTLKVIRKALFLLAMLLLSLAVYFGVTFAVFALTGTEFNDYSAENVNTSVSLIERLRIAYTFFTNSFLYRENALIVSGFSRLMHALLLMCASGELLLLCKRTGKVLVFACAGFLLLLLPLSINCMYLVMSRFSIHTLVLYGFVCVYVLAVLLADVAEGQKLLDKSLRFGSTLAMALILCANVFFANQVYLKMHLEYEEAYSYYTTLLTRVEMTPGYTEKTRLAIIGEGKNVFYIPEEIDTGYLFGPDRELVNIYSRPNFFRFYLGVAPIWASEEEESEIAATVWFAEMPEYPYDGSLRLQDGFLVVKLGEAG